MQFTELEIPGVYVIEPRVFGDIRGYFMESYKKHEFDAHIGPVNFIQDNESSSVYGCYVGCIIKKGYIRRLN